MISEKRSPSSCTSSDDFVGRKYAGKVHSVVGLFAGIGGLELGLARHGHHTSLLCENDSAARAVLSRRFPNTNLHGDVRTLRTIPRSTTLITAGFPCQNLSQAGDTAGIFGAQSGLVSSVFELLERRRVNWVLFENVPFMLSLGRGRAMSYLTGTLESLGYHWAYRIVDSRAFGVPQRRRRVYLLASLQHDPRGVLFADEHGLVEEPSVSLSSVACGFYWTEGNRGLGWAIDAIPTLKGGSSLGIPSPPAIVLPSMLVATPSIYDAERLQGFPPHWTAPAEAVGPRTARWRLIGNAVTVQAASWIGRRLRAPGPIRTFQTQALRSNAPWPNAAWNVDGRRIQADASEWPVRYKCRPLADFLRFEPKPLSARATAGFLARAEAASLNFPPSFLSILRSHLRGMQSI